MNQQGKAKEITILGIIFILISLIVVSTIIISLYYQDNSNKEDNPAIKMFKILRVVSIIFLLIIIIAIVSGFLFSSSKGQRI